MLRALILMTAIVIGNASKLPSKGQSQSQPGLLEVIIPEAHACNVLGETAEFVSLEVMSCTSQPCSWFRGFTYELAVTFTPRMTTNTLRMGGKYKFGPLNPEFMSMDLSGSYEGGQPYRVSMPVTLPTSLPLGYAILQVWLENESERLIDRCFSYTVGTASA